MKYQEPLSKKKPAPYTGIADFVHRFKNDIPLPVVNKTPDEIKSEKKKRKREEYEEDLAKRRALWKPKEDPNALEEAYKTLFVARLSHEVTEENLKQEFEYYGPVVACRLTVDQEGKSRGYGFVQFESSQHLLDAYKDADGRKILGRRILVDVVRGGTVKDFYPRRLGGGLGKTRVGAKHQNSMYSGRETERRDRDRSTRDRDSDRRDRDRDSDRRRRRSRSRDRGDRRDRDRERDRGDRRDRDRGERRDRDRGRDSRRDRDRDSRRDRDRRR